MRPSVPLLLLLIALLCGCITDAAGHRTTAAGNAPELYSDTTLWYSNGRAVNPQLADVFYVLPTCVHDWTDSLGHTHHHALPTDPQQRARMLPSFQLADTIFADSANFFAPYYRHVTLESWALPDSTIDRLFALAMSDVHQAFSYYLRHHNQGRPFVLAGFSQGGRCVIELVKSMPPDVYRRMVAAYVCGYQVSAADTLASTQLRPALRPDDTGVIITYNTVADTLQGIEPTFNAHSVWVTNPASWSPDTLAHPLAPHVTVRIDATRHLLVTTGIDPDQYFIPRYASIIPRGSLHFQELLLYRSQLQHNVKQRIAAMSAR